MRHRVHGKHLSRTYDERRRLRMQLLTALVEHERIETTEAKAEFIRADLEKLVTIAKKGLAAPETSGVHARRLAASRLNNNRDLVGKLFNDIAPRYAGRAGGYTRVYKLGPRKGDAANMVLLEFVDRQETPADDNKSAKKDAKKNDKGADKQ
ncbi:MAG: 50S ribosomal protein L17 [Anaerolineae bacterium]